MFLSTTIEPVNLPPLAKPAGTAATLLSTYAVEAKPETEGIEF